MKSAVVTILILMVASPVFGECGVLPYFTNHPCYGDGEPINEEWWYHNSASCGNWCNDELGACLSNCDTDCEGPNPSPEPSTEACYQACAWISDQCEINCAVCDFDDFPDIGEFNFDELMWTPAIPYAPEICYTEAEG